MKNTLTKKEHEQLNKAGTIYVSRRGQRVRVDAGDCGVITFDYRYRSLAAALAAGPEPKTGPTAGLRIAYAPNNLTR
jgi:hypothetical protein